MMTSIRKIEHRDYEQFKALINMFRETDFTKEQFIDLLVKKNAYSEVWVYEENGVLIGSISLFLEDKFIFNISRVGHIEDVIVHSEHRKKGIGKQLMDVARERAKELGCYKVSLVCSEENKHFYEKCGMEQRGVHMSSLV